MRGEGIWNIRTERVLRRGHLEETMTCVWGKRYKREAGELSSPASLSFLSSPARASHSLIITGSLRERVPIEMIQRAYREHSGEGWSMEHGSGGENGILGLVDNLELVF